MLDEESHVQMVADAHAIGYMAGTFCYSIVLLSLNYSIIPVFSLALITCVSVQAPKEHLIRSIGSDMNTF